jgi:hypothetical protein
MASRLLFLCARESSRALLAASVLNAQADNRWEVWSSPTQDEQGRTLAQQVLYEQGFVPISPDRLIQPTFGIRWNEGIVLCSSAADA